MAEQTRRVGLLKAVGGTPAFVATVLLAENLLLALAAAIIGLAAGRAARAHARQPRPRAARQSPPAPPLTLGSIVLVVGVAVAVAAAATLAPALRGARTSTIRALNDPARPPRRRPLVIALSAALPVPLLLGLRLVARRTRRTRAHRREPDDRGRDGRRRTDRAAQHRRSPIRATPRSASSPPRRHPERQPRAARPQRDPRHPRGDQRHLHRLGNRDRRPRSRRLWHGRSAPPHDRSAPDSRRPSCSRPRCGLRRNTRRAAALPACRRAPERGPPPLLWLLAVIPGTLIAVAAVTAIPARSARTARSPRCCGPRWSCPGTFFRHALGGARRFLSRGKRQERDVRRLLLRGWLWPTGAEVTAEVAAWATLRKRLGANTGCRDLSGPATRSAAVRAVLAQEKRAHGYPLLRLDRLQDGQRAPRPSRRRRGMRRG